MLVKSGHFKNNEVFKNRFRNIFHYSQKFSRMLLAEISSAGMSIRNMKVVIENPGTFGFIYALQAGAVLTSLLIFSLFQAGIELNNFCFISPSS